MHNERANSEPDQHFHYPGVYVRNTVHILEAAKAVWVKRELRDTQAEKGLHLAGLDTRYRLGTCF